MSVDKREYAEGTSVSVRYPWGDVVSARLLCSDGVVRTAANIETPDTWFSTPCTVQVGGKTVRGYMTSGAVSGSSVPTEDDPEVMTFRAYTYGKTAGVLPEWPKLGIT